MEIKQGKPEKSLENVEAQLADAGRRAVSAIQEATKLAIEEFRAGAEGKVALEGGLSGIIDRCAAVFVTHFHLKGYSGSDDVVCIGRARLEFPTEHYMIDLDERQYHNLREGPTLARNHRYRVFVLIEDLDREEIKGKLGLLEEVGDLSEPEPRSLLGDEGREPE